MKKRNIKKLKLKEEVKIIILGSIAMVALMVLYTARIEAINANDNGYTKSGHAQSVNVNIIR